VANEIIKSYQELCDEIDIWKSRVKAYEAEIRALKKLANIYGPSDIGALDYSQDRVQSSTHIGFETYLLRLYEIEAKMQAYDIAIGEMMDAKDTIERKLDEMTGIDHQVVYLRDIKGYKLQEIADQLHFSIDYIKKVSARNKSE
jgi:transcriptional regulator with XRE-family HTH domain